MSPCPEDKSDRARLDGASQKGREPEPRRIVSPARLLWPVVSAGFGSVAGDLLDQKAISTPDLFSCFSKLVRSPLTLPGEPIGH
jgi:hypothetical protein